MNNIRTNSGQKSQEQIIDELNLWRTILQHHPELLLCTCVKERQKLCLLITVHVDGIYYLSMQFTMTKIVLFFPIILFQYTIFFSIILVSFCCCAMCCVMYLLNWSRYEELMKCKSI